MKKLNILLVGNRKLTEDPWYAIVNRDPSRHIIHEPSTKEVMGKANQYHPDIIIIDYTLADAGGLATIDEIKKFYPRSRVLLSNCDEVYNFLCEQATDGILATDAKGNFRDVNHRCCRLLGYSKEDLLHLNLYDLFQSNESISGPIGVEYLDVDGTLLMEGKMVHKDRSVLSVRVSAKKITDDYILLAITDITEHKRIQTTLEKSEANLHTIIDTTDTIYVLMDSQLRIISYNPPAIVFAKNELGITLKISKKFLDYFPEKRRTVLSAYMTKVLAGQPIHYDADYPQPDGSHHYYHVRMFPISKGKAKIYGLMMEVSNITDMKIMEQELLTQKIQEQRNIIRAVLHAQEIERNRIGQELHDNINQVLASVKLYLHLAETDPAVRQHARGRAKELVNLAIHEIRLLSREQVTPQLNFNLEEMLNMLIMDVNEKSEQGTKFHYNIPIELAIAEDLKLTIYRIVQEQINNILKYASASFASITIVQEDSALIISTSDNGKGFDTTITRKGIGISNIINRVESYNGTIIIESDHGKGCKIEISIPLY